MTRLRSCCAQSLRCSVVLVGLALLASAPSAHATKFWKGAITAGNWSTSNNWSAASAGGAFKTNGLAIGSGGALDFDRGVLELAGGTITGLAPLNIPASGEFRAIGTQTMRVVVAARGLVSGSPVINVGIFCDGALTVQLGDLSTARLLQQRRSTKNHK